MTVLWIMLFIVFVYFNFRYAWWKPAIDFSRPRILMYHMISTPISGAKFNGLRVSPENFEKQLSYLKKNGWQFIGMSEYTSHSIQKKQVAITFDDGFEDNYLQAFPLLKKYQAKATLYLVVDRHDNDWSTKKKKHHNSGELAQEPKLTDQQVIEMVQSGIFELGGHTMTHANLNHLNMEQKTKEIMDSKKKLERLYHTHVISFAYPFGIYQQQDKTLVEELGYLNAVTTLDGIGHQGQDYFELPRVKISGKDNYLAFLIKMRIGKKGVNK
ncbi:MAG: polysaccharide deacetylase [Gammaproteobacteria bacterium CG22_combo_CG10-13_8_21_14_all_40_8]|nr:MAG: polysaccharide deacetylase [Gammaproteobacteria bacterium CG22_combo_CG10-13_8_21_14_all_40_8]